MSTPKNPLADFNTYSYHHIFVACDTPTTAEELANLYEPQFFQRDRTDGATKKYDVQYTPSGGQYVVIINGMVDADLIINDIQWIHINSASGAANELQGTASYVEGTMDIIEPFGINFYNVMDKVGDALQRDANGTTWMIKTIFVGNGSNEAATQDRQYISNIKPFIFYMTDITSSFSSAGGEYTINFTGLSNGAAFLAQYNNVLKSTNAITTNGGNTLNTVLTRLQHNLNEAYYRSYLTMKEKLRNLNISSSSTDPNRQGGSTAFSDDPKIPVFSRVEYRIILDEKYNPTKVPENETSLLAFRKTDGTDIAGGTENKKRTEAALDGEDNLEHQGDVNNAQSQTKKESSTAKGYYVLPLDVKFEDEEKIAHVYADGTISFGDNPTIISAIKSIMDHCPKVISDGTIGEGEGANNKRYSYKILSTIVGGELDEDCKPLPPRRPATATTTSREGLSRADRLESERSAIANTGVSDEIRDQEMGNIEYTVVFKIQRYVDPRRSDLLDRAKQSAAVVGDTSNQSLVERNTLHLDYIYTGKNIDILNFDMKMDMGLAFFSTLTTTENQKTQQDSLSGHAPVCEVLKTDMGMRGKKIRPNTPFFAGNKLKDSLLLGKGNLSGVSSYSAALDRHAGLESMEAKVEIVGNPYLLSNLSKLPTEIACGSSDATSNTADKPIEEQIYADWDSFPSLIKINVMMPSDPSRQALQQNFEPFWFRGNYLLFSIQNIFSGGEFRQVLDMVAMPEQIIKNETVKCIGYPKTNVTIDYLTGTKKVDQYYDSSSVVASLREVKRPTEAEGYLNTDFAKQYVCTVDIWDEDKEELIHKEIGCAKDAVLYTRDEKSSIFLSQSGTQKQNELAKSLYERDSAKYVPGPGYRKLHSQVAKNSWRDDANDQIGPDGGGSDAGQSDLTDT